MDDIHQMISSICRQCGMPSDRARRSFCRRCGLPYGQPPSRISELPACPVCYRTTDDDGRLPSLDRPTLRVDLGRHRDEHDRHPVGDDDWLESLRMGDHIRIDRWTASFDTVRRYLVTGQIDAGHERRLAHDVIVTAMTQLNRWGPDADILDDAPDWKSARAAVTTLMERYARGRRRN